MNNLWEKYNRLIDTLNPKGKKYVHHNSVKNFILHIEDIRIEEDAKYCISTINEYLDLVSQIGNDIDSSMGIELFEKFISPIGERFKLIGFSNLVRIRYLIVFALMIDSLLFIAFFHFPYPITILFVLAYFIIIQRPYYQAHKVYAVYY